jgi:hypothetical protein
MNKYFLYALRGLVCLGRGAPFGVRYCDVGLRNLGFERPNLRLQRHLATGD